MSDDKKIFQLYVENVEQGGPQKHVYADGIEAWTLHGKLHRIDGPAYMDPADGSKEWWQHGELHRDDGPAVEGADGTHVWYKHGKLHREDGPAYEEGDGGHKEWWLNSIMYDSAEQWAEALLMQRNEPHDAQAIDTFLKQVLKKNVDEAI